MAVLGVVTVALIAALTNCTSQLGKRNRMEVIDTWAELQTKAGHKVTIRGTYTLVNPFPSGKKKAAIPWIVQIVMEDGDREGPFVEAYWDPAARRSQAEMDTFKDQRVEVTGIFHARQPPQPGAPDGVAAFGGSCITQVEGLHSIALPHGRGRPK